MVKYTTLSDCAYDCAWYKNLFGELGKPMLYVPIYGDSSELSLVFSMEKSDMSMPVQGFAMCCGLFFFRSNLSPFSQSPCQTLQLNEYTTKGPNAFPNCHDFPSPTWQWGSLDSLLTFMTVVKFIF